MSHRTAPSHLLVPLLLLASSSAPLAPAAKADEPPSSHAAAGKPASSASCDLRSAMAGLWSDHVTWTRTYIISALADLPDKDAAAARLLQNQADIGDAIKPYYGDAAGDKLTALLKDHIVIATELVSAAKSGDVAKKDDANRRWQGNADQIATFLSTANPKNWPAAEMRTMMREHLDLTTAEVVARLNRDWKGDVAAYDEIRAQALGMADMLATGIAAQFPERMTPGMRPQG